MRLYAMRMTCTFANTLNADKFLVPLNTQHDEIELKGEFEVVGCIVQQKQRKQKPLHYYHLNKDTKTLDFSISGKIKQN